MNQQKTVRIKRTNIPLLLMMFALVVFGLIVLYSVSAPAGYGKSKDSFFYVSKQIQYTLVGLVPCIALNFVDVNWFKKKIVCLVTYGVTLVAIIFTAVAGKTINGAKRWIGFGGLTFQTSELAKIGLVLSYACYRSWILDLRKKGKLKAETPGRQILKDAMFDLILPIGLAAVVDLFIIAQPHVSCALIIAFVIFMCALASGVSGKSWVISLSILLGMAIVGLLAFSIFNPGFVEKNFQHAFKRVQIFQSQHGDEEAATALTDDDTRQVDNAHNALGSGGLKGMGLGNSRSKYFYVSEAQNDYIFSIFVEETGFIGGTFLIMVYLVFFGVSIWVILRTNSVFTRMLATGYTSLIMIQVLLNIAVELQVIPATGVTLPFISYGGTAQIFLLTSYGMLLCVARSGVRFKEERKLETYR